jgi:hypothetical protein
MRLSTTWAIHQARDAVAIVYGAAGSTAVFNENRSSAVRATSTPAPGKAKADLSISRPLAKSSSASPRRAGCSADPSPPVRAKTTKIASLHQKQPAVSQRIIDHLN